MEATAPPTTMTTTAFSDNNTTTNISYAVSEAERRQYLQHLQDDTTITMIPAMCFLLLLAVTGVVGNCLVLFVYSRKLRWTPTTIFVMVIAVFDLVANVVAIPGEVYDMFHIWDFNNPPLCRARLYVNTLTTLSSGMLLLAVAVVRYRKVCVPYGWQINARHAKIICVTIAILSLLFSAPYGVINGRQTKDTPRPDIHGYECTTDDRFVDTIWPLVNSGFFLLLFFAFCVPFVTLYVLIGVQAWRHSKLHGMSDSATTSKSVVYNSSTAAQSDHQVDTKTLSQPRTLVSRRQKSKESLGFGSIADVMDEYEDEIRRSDNIDQYNVRFLDDSVEISTPIIGNIRVDLTQNCSPDPEQKTRVVLDNQTKITVERNPDLDASSHISGDRQDDIAVHSSAPEELEEHLENGEIPTEPTVQNSSSINPVDVEMQDDARCDSPSDSESASHMKSHSSAANGQYQNGHSEKMEKEQLAEDARSSSDSVAPPLHTRPSQASSPSSGPPGGDKDNTQSVTNYDSDGAAHGDHDTRETKGLSMISADLNINNEEQLDTGSAVSVSPNSDFHAQLSDANRMAISNRQLREASRQEKDVLDRECDENDNPVMKGEQISENISSMEFQSHERPHSSTSVLNKLRGVVNKVSFVKRSNSERQRSRRRPLGRTTAMLIIISAIYVTAFLPYLILSFFRFNSPDKYNAMNMVEASFYNLFLRFFFLNSAANPIVYSFCDVSFRRECLKIFRCRG